MTAFRLYVWVYEEGGGKKNDSPGKEGIIMDNINEKITGSQQATLFMSRKD